jgi:peroxiredoxin
MRLRTILVSSVVAGTCLMGQTATPPKTHLKVGDPAPDFSLPTTAGQPFKLSDYKGKKTVVVAFFPMAFTGGCTKEMTSFQATLSKFEDSGAQIVGVSTDNLGSLNYWSKEVIKTAFPLASDNLHKVGELYGVLIPDRGIENRTTFVVDQAGVIQHVEEGTAAVSTDGAMTACSRLQHK